MFQLGLDTVAVALAAVALMNAWFRGSMFVGPKAWSEARGGWLGELLDCPLCLSFYPTALLMIVFILPATLLPEPYGDLLRLPVYGLGSAALVQLYFYLHPKDQ